MTAVAPPGTPRWRGVLGCVAVASFAVVGVLLRNVNVHPRPRNAAGMRPGPVPRLFENAALQLNSGPGAAVAGGRVPSEPPELAFRDIGELSLAVLQVGHWRAHAA